MFTCVFTKKVVISSANRDEEIAAIGAGSWPRDMQQETADSDSIFSKIPFGKFKGKLICELPFDYLNWLVSNASTASESVKKAANSVLDNRLRAKNKRNQKGGKKMVATYNRKKNRFENKSRGARKAFNSIIPPGERIMSFGKHKGLRINEIPLNYLQWMMQQETGSKMFEDMRLAVKAFLGKPFAKVERDDKPPSTESETAADIINKNKQLEEQVKGMTLSAGQIEDVKDCIEFLRVQNLPNANRWAQQLENLINLIRATL